ncbi:MAG TPA: hypothetical protein VF461_22755 [Gemmatimonadaceae bacterium]
MMSDSPADLDVLAQLTPRQDRLEGALVRALVAGAPRSEVREIVREYADLLTMQGVSPDQTIATLQSVARRARPRMHERDASIAGDSADDRLALIARWCTAWIYRPHGTPSDTRAQPNRR